MIGEIHHVPGRLRIKARELKRNPQRATTVETAVRQHQGITSAEVNELTGSLLIYYDPKLIGRQAVLELIANENIHPDPDSRPATPSQHKVADALLWWALEKAVERSIPLMIGALL
jgi:hypothetical protein